METIMFDIVQTENKEFIQVVADQGYLRIPLWRIKQLPMSMRLKFETQKKISFRVLMTVISIWLLNEPRKKDKQ